MTLDVTEHTCWLHSSGSALRQGGLCLQDISVLKLPVFITAPCFLLQLSPAEPCYVKIPMNAVVCLDVCLVCTLHKPEKDLDEVFSSGLSNSYTPNVA